MEDKDRRKERRFGASIDDTGTTPFLGGESMADKTESGPGKCDESLKSLAFLIHYGQPTEARTLEYLRQRVIPLLNAADAVVESWESSGDAVTGARELRKELEPWEK